MPAKMHLSDAELMRLSQGHMTTFMSLNAQRHLFHCPSCLKRLITLEVLVAATDCREDPQIYHSRKPLFIKHDTGDGFIFCRVERDGRTWVARHWGNNLNGTRTCRTMREANEHAIQSFREMFPEHRCTQRCLLNPVDTADDNEARPPHRRL